MADYNKIHAALNHHFIAWHKADDRIGGDWVCMCGKRFGFSDSAVSHQAAMVVKALNPPISEADRWDELKHSRSE